jgi:Zn-dependent protease
MTSFAFLASAPPSPHLLQRNPGLGAVAMARMMRTLRAVMKWSWKLGRFAGIDTYVHATFLLLIGWAAWAAYAGAGSGLAMILGVGFLLAVFGSVLLHELGHALMARRYGIRTRRIVLSPIGGLAQLEGMPSDPRHELAVALAGPAVNFALAAVLWIVGLGAGPSLAFGLLDALMWANLTLGAFNLVPAFPMDGGRALRALLAMRVSDLSATEIAARVGKTAALVMGVVGLFTNWILVGIAVFVWLAANAELRAARADAAWQLLERPVWPSPRTDYDWPRAPVSLRPGRGPGYQIVIVARPAASTRGL